MKTQGDVWTHPESTRAGAVLRPLVSAVFDPELSGQKREGRELTLGLFPVPASEQPNEPGRLLHFVPGREGVVGKSGDPPEGATGLRGEAGEKTEYIRARRPASQKACSLRSSAKLRRRTLCT